MSYGKRFDEWDRSSLIAALIHNDPEGRRPRLQPADLNPFLANRPKLPEQLLKISVTDLAAALGNKPLTLD